MYKKFIETFIALPMIFLVACGDENAFSASKDKIDESIYDQSQEIRQSSSSRNEENACYYGTSTHTDSWCCNNYGYRCYAYSSSSNGYYFSSSSKETSGSLKTEKTIKFSLTNYKQVTPSWDGAATGISGTDKYEDGDPIISFTLYFISETDDTTKASTGTLLSLTNTGSWNGEKSKVFIVPANTYKISVCPSVYDSDPLVNENMSSKYCYNKTQVGKLKDYSIQYQSDYENTDCNVNWEWYLN